MSALAEALTASAFVATLCWALHEANRARLCSRTLFWAATWAAAGALSLGDLWLVLLPRAGAEPYALGWLNVLEAEKSSFGAFLGAAIFGGSFLRWRRASLLAYADAAVPAIALGYAISRIGCFVSGDCFGTLTNVPWAVTFLPGTEAFAVHAAGGLISPEGRETLPVHPTQLYHAAAGALSFLALTRLGDARPGTRLTFALLAYAGSRFVIEFFRGDAVPVWRMLDLNQILCIAMIATGALVWMLRPQNGVDGLRERAA